MNILRSNLGKRILLLVSVSMTLMLVAFAISGWLAVSQSFDRVRQERLALSQAAAKYLDHVLEQNLRLLENFRYYPGVDLADDNPDPEQNALHSIFLNSFFDGEVFLADQSGSVQLLEPARQNTASLSFAKDASFVNTLSTGRTTISTLETDPVSGQPAILIFTPVHNQQGKLDGVVGGSFDPTGKSLQDVTNLVTLDDDSFIDVLDAHNDVIASSDPQRVSQSSPSAEPKNETSVVAASAYAPWSVAVRQAAGSAQAPLRSMELRLVIFGLASIVVVLLFGWGMARSIIKPLNQLKESAQNLAEGDLSQPIPQTSDDEIGQLNHSFETMRVSLKESLDEIRHLNRDLESIVKKRTRQLEASYHEIERKESARGELLRKLFTAQEEERRRIARELHDETSQSLNGLVMRLEAASASDSAEKTRALLDEMKKLAVRTVDNVHKVIFDLRPAILDDLGLLPAVRWYAQNRLSEQKVNVRIEVTGEERKLPAHVENGIFRVVQEAVNNIARHAEAQSVLLSVEYEEKALKIEIDDDGKGFVEKEYDPQQANAQGLGLMGMRERISILGGELKITSEPGKGTHIYLRVPLP